MPEANIKIILDTISAPLFHNLDVSLDNPSFHFIVQLLVHLIIHFGGNVLHARPLYIPIPSFTLPGPQKYVK